MTNVESLGRRIRDARKAKGMTQEQLASALYVSRQTVSSWENDRSQPDYETMMRLMKLLEADAFPKEDAPAKPEEKSAPLPLEQPEQGEQPETQPKTQPERKSKPAITKRTAVILAAAVVFLFVMLYMPKLRQSGSSYTVDWFQQAQQKEPGKAYIVFTTHTTLPVPIDQQTAESTPTWGYTMYIKEQNGIGVTVDELTHVLFFKNGRTQVYAKTMDVFGENNGGKKSYIGANEMRRIQPRRLADKLSTGEGWFIRGMDDNGNEVCFRVYIPVETM